MNNIQVSDKTVETIMQVKVMIKEIDILQKVVIRKGLQHIFAEELAQYAHQKTNRGK